jgi:2-hydroxychromene-2-carboxylate isomerase
MKQIHFHFDVISPYAYLAFDSLPKALEGISHSVVYKPVLFGAILQHFGQLGPAEIAPKRTWTYRLALACGQAGACNRYVTQMVFEHVWHGGQEASDPQRLAALTEKLQPRRAMDDAAVKAELKANTDAAIGQGIFGVPTMEVDGQLFWGLDALPMLRAYLMGDDWFASPAWKEAGVLPTGVVRKR